MSRRTRTTRSGYTYTVLSAREMAQRVAEFGDYWAWTCRYCNGYIQGGSGAVDEHIDIVHPEQRDADRAMVVRRR
ncbi:hypothetical protein [Streptomyces sp. cg35]|uniref:hypothetical protein n=1 Tax=Streptomyces sp. cg35 TaxID=3421650 RepID=UPI003D184932